MRIASDRDTEHETVGVAIELLLPVRGMALWRCLHFKDRDDSADLYAKNEKSLGVGEPPNPSSGPRNFET
ncbi:hypothetical protein TNCV_1501031 [Trichonephila clavipes]|uniref:Uncharacterized protein n=1 Tax=Trichonephila clavipes TaxID=2585209 RepID=A0A8X6RQ70_TRICX|nr:hypothetical protein TNCV_1501031 [Trichonephila clavipes]